jgi:hypothetical protein
MAVPLITLLSVRQAVLRMIERGTHPTREDVALALEGIPDKPVPQRIIDYVRRVYVRGQPRRTGPIAGRNTQARDNLIRIQYQIHERALRASEESTEVKRLAVRQTSIEFQVSPRTVQRIVSRQKT